MFRAQYKTTAIIFLTLFFCLSGYSPAFAASKNAWAMFSTREDGKKICYITSNPVKETGTYHKRGDAYIIVTFRGAGTTPETSISSGFPFKEDSEVSFQVDKKNAVMFFTSDETPEMAWAKSERDDKDVVALMKKGNKVVVNETSTKNTKAIDTYSLKGFSAAYDKMVSNCK